MYRNKWITVTGISRRTSIGIDDVFQILVSGRDSIFSVNDSYLWRIRKKAKSEYIDEVKKEIVRLSHLDLPKDSSGAIQLAQAYDTSMLHFEKKIENKLSNKLKHTKRRAVAVHIFNHSSFGIGRRKTEEYTGPKKQYWTDPNFKKIDSDA